MPSRFSDRIDKLRFSLNPAIGCLILVRICNDYANQSLPGICVAVCFIRQKLNSVAPYFMA